MALGAEPAAELWQAATEGRFTLTAEAAHEMAGHYQWYADELRHRADEIALQQKLDGFGSLNSAQHLQAGFERKAVQAFEAYGKAQESALRMKAAVLRAASLTEEVDAANTAALNAATRKITDVKA
ncbi:hypothetical protein [Nocardia macrotermitis]|uniref:Uncharacterized protein n=1 Tax=Nocardia macrotermitis TaxID=2585198 RepID=A0A7K0DFQ5_9NOCA|nr:hypothetical protein [Nocardia macrotermitis]MQY24371.1 hypothetical protein [Nocardia macrotermitis]